MSSPKTYRPSDTGFERNYPSGYARPRMPNHKDKQLCEAMAAYRRRGYLIAERAKILALTPCTTSGSDVSPRGAG